jgi:histidinol-phosphate aminotransferase
MPFNVSLPAQAAAIAALEDDAFTEESLLHNEREMVRLANGLKALGLELIDGVGNFVVAKFPEAKGKTAAEALAYLKDRGISLRGLGGYGMPSHLRISVGTVEGNDAALKLLKEFLGK